jgi:hypothetical protein
MSVNFPNNPTVGLSWLDPSNNVSYIWDGIKWISTGTGISYNVTIFSVANDDPDLVGGNTTDVINAFLLANGDISSVGILRPGNTLLVTDSGNPDTSVYVSIGQYLFDGLDWLRIPGAVVQVLSVFGRIGGVVAEEGDYSIGQMSDVSLASPTPTSTTNSLLRFNGTSYVPGEARNAPTVVLPLTSDADPVTPELGFDISGLNVLPDV